MHFFSIKLSYELQGYFIQVSSPWFISIYYYATKIFEDFSSYYCTWKKSILSWRANITEWCSAYTETTQGETWFSNKVKKRVQKSKIHWIIACIAQCTHWVNPELCTVRTKSTQSNALHTQSQRWVMHCIYTLSQRRVKHCTYWVTHSYAVHTLSQHRVMHCIYWVNWVTHCIDWVKTKAVNREDKRSRR